MLDGNIVLISRLTFLPIVSDVLLQKASFTSRGRANQLRFCTTKKDKERLIAAGKICVW